MIPPGKAVANHWVTTPLDSFIRLLVNELCLAGTIKHNAHVTQPIRGFHGELWRGKVAGRATPPTSAKSHRTPTSIRSREITKPAGSASVDAPCPVDRAGSIADAACLHSCLRCAILCNSGLFPYLSRSRGTDMILAKSAFRFCSLFLALMVLASAPVLAGGLSLGTAAVKITPPIGIPLAGYYSPRGSEGVLDDLYTKVVVLDDGQTQVAMVVCDLITVPRHTVLEARKLIEQQTKIPGSRVMISATHTHTGPVLARETARDDSDGGSGDLANKYTAELPAKIAQGVAEASGRLVPVRTSFAHGHEDRMAFTRRFWMKDGTVGWNPGKKNPNIIRPVSPIDPEVGVVYFETAEGKPALTYVNYAMHPDTTGGLKFWPDYPGVLARRLADVKGDEMLTIFANGTCGNLNHINVQWSDRQHGQEEAIRLGTILADDVLKAYMDLRPAADGALQVRSEVLSLPLAPVTEKDIAEAREVVKRGAKAKFMEQVQAYKVLDVVARDGKAIG